jgi:hypothetical protein
MTMAMQLIGATMTVWPYDERIVAQVDRSDLLLTLGTMPFLHLLWTGSHFIFGQCFILKDENLHRVVGWDAQLRPLVVVAPNEADVLAIDLVKEEFDALAAEGIRYRNAFANAPVCSTARTTLITGMHASSLGLHNHRSRAAMPDAFLLYPQHLRAAGYYCTNNSKEDYNIAGHQTREIWDESSNQAHYENREDGQPFFAVFNSGLSHEGRVHNRIPADELRHDPGDVTVPPYLPDTPDIRHDLAQYYDHLENMDAWVGELLQELGGLAALPRKVRVQELLQRSGRVRTVDGLGVLGPLLPARVRVLRQFHLL